MSDAIVTQELSKRFGDKIAVDRVTFSIPTGVVFGFLGPNGSGKSTTIRMLCGVLAPSGGAATVLGFDVNRDPERIKECVGYMSQKFSLYQDLTIRENLDFYGGVYGLYGSWGKARKEAIIEEIGLAERLDQLTGRLSGGWKQRVALACALVHNPRLLVLDEPTAGVDPVSRRLFWETIHRLAKGGMTILVSTHYMDEAETCALVGFIFYGRLLAFGTPAELKEREKCPTLDDVFIHYVEREGGPR